LVLRNITINISDEDILGIHIKDVYFHSIDNLYEVIEKLKKIKIVSDNDDNMDIKITVDNVHGLKIHKNKLRIQLYNITIDPYKYLHCSELHFYCFRRNIIAVYNIILNFNKNELIIDKLLVNIYNSLCHKLYLSLDIYISKTSVKLPTSCKKTKYNLSNKTLLNYIDDKQITAFDDKYDSIYDENIPNDLTSSFIIDKNKISDLISSYMKPGENIELNIMIDKFNADFIENNKVKTDWEFSNFNYSVTKTGETHISTGNWKICNNNILILNKVKGVNIVHILYKSNKVDVTIANISINIIPDIFAFTYKIISNNVKYINKLLYNCYNSDFIIDDFFIKYISIPSFNVKLTYIPASCDYYKILFGNTNEKYNMINYENIHLISKNISIHYPYNFSLLFSTILKMWLNDVSENQIGQIIKGTKFKYTVDNTPLNLSKDMYKHIHGIICYVLQYIKT